METIFSPLFTRLQQKYARFPVSCGVTLPASANKEGCFARLRESLVLLETFQTVHQLIRLLSAPHYPEIVCLSAAPNQRRTQLFSMILSALQAENLMVIITDVNEAGEVLDFSDNKVEIAMMLQQLGFDLRPSSSHPAASVAIAALTGYFYLNHEYETSGITGSVIPLLLEMHPLYHFLRKIPYGEVTTFADVGKTLGLQWNEQTIMAELRRLHPSVDVPGHRLVQRDGNLSTSLPEGLLAQKERLRWELVPFIARERVNLTKVHWTRQKYRPLTNFLRHSAPGSQFVELQFDQVEQILGTQLPRAARRLGSWWQDEKAYATIWQEAGCHITRVNLQTQTVTFSRKALDNR